MNGAPVRGRSAFWSSFSAFELSDEIAKTIGNRLLNDRIVHRPQMLADALLRVIAETSTRDRLVSGARTIPAAMDAGLPIFIHAVDPLRACDAGLRRYFSRWLACSPPHGCCCNAVVCDRFLYKGTKQWAPRYGRCVEG